MPEKHSHDSSGMWRVWIPSLLLMVIAIAQVTLTRTDALCPWKGGGFGMFATNDSTDGRDVRGFIERPMSSEKLDIAPHSTYALQAKLFPSDSMLRRLALAVVSREQSYKRPVSAVKLEVWRTEFEIGSLEATKHLVRAFTYRVDQSAD